MQVSLLSGMAYQTPQRGHAHCLVFCIFQTSHHLPTEHQVEHILLALLKHGDSKLRHLGLGHHLYTRSRKSL